MAKTKVKEEVKGEYLDYLTDDDKRHLARVEALSLLMIKHKIPLYKQGDYELVVSLDYHEKVDQPDLSKYTQQELDKLMETEDDAVLFKSST